MKKKYLQKMVILFLFFLSGPALFGCIKFDALKQHIELLIKHENVIEAKSKLEANINQFLQTSDKFQGEINVN